VPVIIFVQPTDVSTRSEFRSELRLYGSLDCVTCRLADLDAQAELATGNIAAATHVMSMRYAPLRPGAAALEPAGHGPVAGQKDQLD
jgi:hypothetical protein